MTVAPLVGAWIEIYVDLDAAKDGYGVAPLVGAWIEIEQLIEDYERARESLPSWERGLKSVSEMVAIGSAWSLPSWERGLKWNFGSLSR